MQRETCEFTSFVRANTSALLRTAYLLTGSAAGAEDLVQETFARLYPNWSRVAAADVPMAYVRRSLANAFVNQRRKASSREYPVDALPDRADPHDDIAQLSDRAHVWALLGELPERQRAALVLRYFDDLPDDEIAAAINARAGTVRSLISRGLATMRERSAGAEAAWPAPRRQT